jgi:transcriptional regulator with XRE-family HTH domain
MKTNAKTFKQLFAAARERLAYHVEGAILEFTEEIVAHMEVEKVSNAELAKRLDSSPAYVTKVLRGNTNFTLESMVKIARALNAELRVHLQPAGSKTQWLDKREAVEEAAEKQAEVPDWTPETCREIQPQPIIAGKTDGANEDIALAA